MPNEQSLILEYLAVSQLLDDAHNEQAFTLEVRHALEKRHAFLRDVLAVHEARKKEGA